jgi:glucose-1-phosphate adenylyltransferase
MQGVLTFVLGGGRGTRLYPLTKYRSKPAVPLAGSYRLIDIPISNCLNSGLNRVYVLTQFNSVSLHRHIRRAYTFDQFGGGFVEILAAQQTNDSTGWYQGTADAVRQNIRYVEQHGIEYVIILSGDQLYRMNYLDMLEEHRASGADVTIAALPVDESAAKHFGIIRVDDTGRVVGFLEKPQTRSDLDLVRTEPAWIDARGIQSRGRSCLASMGIYIFNRNTLLEVLTKTEYHDFGKEIFPASIRARRVQMHLFDGYWEDIGTIEAFFDANLALASSHPPFDFVSAQRPIYTRPRFLPPARIVGATVRDSLICEGCVIEAGAIIENCVIGPRCHVGAAAVLRNAVVMGADFYESPNDLAANLAAGRPKVGIGAHALIERAIIDKNARIGERAQLTNQHRVTESPESPEAVICDGIIVVPKDAIVPPAWRL